MAPEVNTSQKYDGFAADVWSLGVCLFAMVCGAVPFRGNNVEELQSVIQKSDFVYPDNLSKTLSKEV